MKKKTMNFIKTFNKLTAKRRLKANTKYLTLFTPQSAIFMLLIVREISKNSNF